MITYLSFWLLVAVICFCIGFILPFFYDGFKLKFNIFTQYIYSKFLPHSIGNKTVYLVNDTNLFLNFAILYESFYYTKLKEVEAFFIKGFGYKEPVSFDEMKKIQSLSSDFLVVAAFIYACLGIEVKGPKHITDFLVKGKPLFVEDFFKLLNTESHVEMPADVAAQKGNYEGKEAGNDCNKDRGNDSGHSGTSDVWEEPKDKAE